MPTPKLVQIAQHSSKTNEHPTPGNVVEGARWLMGTIDLDPASCKEFNGHVRARTFYDKELDGLKLPWVGNVFLNPPGGCMRKDARGAWVPAKTGKSAAAIWWARLVEQWMLGEVKQAVFVGFTLEVMRTTQLEPCMRPLVSFPFCMPNYRLCFGGESPTHSNVIAYLPDRATSERLEAFKAAFGSLGSIVIPEGWQESAC